MICGTLSPRTLHEQNRTLPSLLKMIGKAPSELDGAARKRHMTP
jgi:hypothetical protein